MHVAGHLQGAAYEFEFSDRANVGLEICQRKVTQPDGHIRNQRKNTDLALDAELASFGDRKVGIQIKKRFGTRRDVSNRHVQGR